MKRTYYNAIVRWIGSDGLKTQTCYENYKKITYQMNGNNLKVYLHSWSGSVITEGFTNVETIRVMKYKK